MRGIRYRKRGVKVRVLRGPMAGRIGISAGQSSDRPEWTRVLMGPQEVPWRFDPADLVPVANPPEDA